MLDHGNEWRGEEGEGGKKGGRKRERKGDRLKGAQSTSTHVLTPCCLLLKVGVTSSFRLMMCGFPATEDYKLRDSELNKLFLP